MNKFNLSISILLATGVPALAGPYDAWSQNRTITLNTSATGANVAGTVTDFPVLIRLNATEATIFTQAKAGGADIRFSKANDSILPYQIERWDAAGNRAEIWVKVDTVRGNNSTQGIRMYWGNAAAGSESNGAAVFDTAAGYVGVWHMGDTGGVPDATANGLTGANFGTTAAAGNVGGARAFDGSTQYVSVANDSRLDIPQTITVSAWVRATDLTGGSRRVVQRGSQPAYSLRDDGTDNILWDLNNSGTPGSAQFLGSTIQGAWHLLHATHGDGFARLYRNGVLVDSVARTDNITGNNTQAFGIGRDISSTTAGRYWLGDLDEVRVSKVTRNANYVKLEFESQKRTQALTNIGVFVPTAPGAPAAVAGTAGNAQVAVSWAAPADDGGANVTAYTVSASPGTATCATTGALTCNVTGLTNGTAYTFTVTATNSVGTSAPSAPSAAVTPMAPTVPGAPTGAFAFPLAAGSGQVNVSWNAPASNGGAAITAYTVSASSGTATCATTGALSCNVTGLTPGTAYSFTVRATNAVGMGAASAPSNTVTRINPGSFVFRVTGNEKPYAFRIPQAAVASTEKVTLTITDTWGRTVWSRSILPSLNQATQAHEIAWDGRTARGVKASAGMYVVRVSVHSGATVTQLIEETVTLKP